MSQRRSTRNRKANTKYADFEEVEETKTEKSPRKPSAEITPPPPRIKLIMKKSDDENDDYLGSDDVSDDEMEEEYEEEEERKGKKKERKIAKSTPTRKTRSNSLKSSPVTLPPAPIASAVDSTAGSTLEGANAQGGKGNGVNTTPMAQAASKRAQNKEGGSKEGKKVTVKSGGVNSGGGEKKIAVKLTTKRKRPEKPSLMPQKKIKTNPTKTQTPPAKKRRLKKKDDEEFDDDDDEEDLFLSDDLDDDDDVEIEDDVDDDEDDEIDEMEENFQEDDVATAKFPRKKITNQIGAKNIIIDGGDEDEGEGEGEGVVLGADGDGDGDLPADDLSSDPLFPKKGKGNLTMRQKAMLMNTKKEDFALSSTASELLSLPLFDSKKKSMKEEDKNKKNEMALKRKLLQERQSEEEKRAVIDKLLNRQTKQEQEKHVIKKYPEIGGPKIVFRSTSDLSLLSFPDDFLPPFLTPPPLSIIREKERCAGCDQPKKYNCSKSKLPFCSLLCYSKQSSLLLS